MIKKHYSAAGAVGVVSTVGWASAVGAANGLAVGVLIEDNTCWIACVCCVLYISEL